MDAPLAQIEQTLRDELPPLRSTAETLATQLTAVREQIERIETALVVLGGGDPKPGSSKPRRGRPCATRQDVLDLACAELTRSGELDVAALEHTVKQQIKDRLGKSRNGFGLRFREVLGDPQIKVVDGRCSLAESAPALISSGAQELPPK